MPQILLFSQYAAAAYCPANFNSPGTLVSCGGSCPLVEESKAFTHAEFTKTKKTDATGYVAYDPTHQVIVVAFRGSSSLKNWMTDFRFRHIKADLCDKCEVHRGFWTSWIESRDSVVPAVKLVLALHPKARVVVTGHSLGGAIAVLAAAELRKHGHWVDLYTFGAPRVGTKEVAHYLAGTLGKGKTYRITNLDDPVPHLPPAKFGYRQTFPEYHIDKVDNPITSKDMVYYRKPYGKAQKIGFKMDTRAHVTYFGNISSCDYAAQIADSEIQVNATQLQDIADDPTVAENNFFDDLNEYGIDGIEGETDNDLMAEFTPQTDHMGNDLPATKSTPASTSFVHKGKYRPKTKSNFKVKYEKWKANHKKEEDE